MTRSDGRRGGAAANWDLDSGPQKGRVGGGEEEGEGDWIAGTPVLSTV